MTDVKGKRRLQEVKQRNAAPSRLSVGPAAELEIGAWTDHYVKRVLPPEGVIRVRPGPPRPGPGP